MFEFDVAAGGKVPVAHSHVAYEETIYGLAGVLTMTVDGRRSEVGPSDALGIARGAVHHSTTFIRPTRRCWLSSPPASSAQIISAK